MVDDDILEGAALQRLLRIGDQDFLLEMIDLFLKHAPERVRAAREAAATGDDQALYRAAHSLKSTAANLGARALQRIAEQVEGQAAAKDTAAIPPLLEEMAARYEDVRQRLEAERRRRSGG